MIKLRDDTLEEQNMGTSTIEVIILVGGTFVLKFEEDKDVCMGVRYS